MIQGIIFSVPGSISPSAPSELSIEHSDGAASGFQPTANIKFIKRCAGILRITKKKDLARSNKVKIRILIVQLYNYWGPTPDCRGPPVANSRIYQTDKVTCRPNETE